MGFPLAILVLTATLGSEVQPACSEDGGEKYSTALGVLTMTPFPRVKRSRHCRSRREINYRSSKDSLSGEIPTSVKPSSGQCITDPGKYCNGFAATAQSRDLYHVFYQNPPTSWGNWGEWAYCPPNQFVVAFDMKIEGNLVGDDTALNGIAFKCSVPGLYPNENEMNENRIFSSVGPWGVWVGAWRHPSMCYTSTGAASGLDIKWESAESCGVGCDDTAINRIELLCNHWWSTGGHQARSPDHSRTGWGDWRKYPLKCKNNYYICGLRTKLEPSQGTGDDTALTDVQIACCSR